jgi:hypothetical protein
MLPLVLLAALKKNPNGLRKAKGIGRVMVWVTCVSAAGMLFLGQSARAHARQSTLAFGHELAALSTTPEGVTHLKLNGQSIYYAQEFNKASVHDVIGMYQTACEKNPGAFGLAFGKEQLKDPSGAAIPPPPNEVANGIIKDEGDTEGTLICFTKGAKSQSTVHEAMARFNETQDLGEIGRLRYVYVHKGEELTQTITAWTEDSFRFDKIGLASSSQEAPGTDTALPRPEGSRRVLNAEVVGTPYGVHVYEVTQSTDEIATFYDNWAHGAGFTGIAPDLENGARVRAYFHEGSQVMVGAFETHGKRYLSISEINQQNKVQVSHDPQTSHPSEP